MWCATAQWWWHPGESPNLRRTRIVYRGPRLEAAASRVCLAHERVHLGQKRFRMPGSYRAKVTGTPGNTTVCTGCIFLWLHRIIHQKIPESSKRTVVLHWGNILPSGDIWQCLETTFHSYGGCHWLSGGPATSYHTQGGPHNKTLSSHRHQRYWGWRIPREADATHTRVVYQVRGASRGTRHPFTSELRIPQQRSSVPDPGPLLYSRSSEGEAWFKGLNQMLNSNIMWPGNHPACPGLQS